VPQPKAFKRRHEIDTVSGSPAASATRTWITVAAAISVAVVVAVAVAVAVAAAVAVVVAVTAVAAAAVAGAVRAPTLSVASTHLPPAASHPLKLRRALGHVKISIYDSGDI
jgi:hypothetical protein